MPGASGSQGKAYYFAAPDTWINATQTATLTASDAAAGNRFGSSVSISGSVAVRRPGGNGSLGEGYVFTEYGDAWSDMIQPPTLEGLNATANDGFGGGDCDRRGHGGGGGGQPHRQRQQQPGRRLRVQCPYGLSPAQVRTAYGLNSLGTDANSQGLYGYGQTIAIVGNYDDPNLLSDVDLFDKQVGLTRSSPSLYAQFGRRGPSLACTTSTAMPPRCPLPTLAAARKPKSCWNVEYGRTPSRRRPRST